MYDNSSQQHLWKKQNESSKPNLKAGYMLLTAVFYLLAFSPFDIAEAGYIFAVPGLIWLSSITPRKRDYLFVYITGVFTCLLLMIWLRHVNWIGTVLLAMVLSVFWSAFLIVAASILNSCRNSGVIVRILCIAGAAGAGVLIEYGRSNIFTGFPWLPLAASQWHRPILLQILEYTGSWGLSYVLYFFNVTIALYILRLPKTLTLRKWRLSPEVIIAMLLAFALPIALSYGVRDQQREPLFKAGILQPYIPAKLRWDILEYQHNIRIIQELTLRFRDEKADLILMPEAILPFSVSDIDFRKYLENLSDIVETPILTGVLNFDGTLYYNGAVVIYPKEGMSDLFYYKRKLVPYGEYTPMSEYLPFLRNFLPLVMEPGKSSKPLPVRINNHELQAGVLICYEDAFSELSRQTVLEGADFLFVGTNNAWYGEEAGSYQHAVHSALRAVETRRPVVRCGNGGWSGWFDEYGNLRDSPLQENGTIYFRGIGVLELDRDARWIGRHTFYVQHGDWFAAFSAFLMIFPLGRVIYLRRTIKRQGMAA